MVWSGRTADRAQHIEVIEDAGLSYVVIDGKRRAAYHGIAGWSIALAGEHIAFAARVEDHWRVVVDGQPGALFDRIGALVVTGGGRAVYAARRAGAWHIVDGDHVGPAYDAILADTLQISGTHVAYVGQHAGRVQLVHDGRPQPWFDGIGQLTLTADGTRVMYAARNRDDAFVVVDGHPSRAWGAVARLVLGPPGHWAYAASEGDGWRIVIDGEPGPTVDAIRRIVIRDDGAHVAWQGRLAGVDVLSLDERPVAVVPATAPFAFRSTGESPGLAYVIADAAGQHVVIDDIAGPAFDEVGALRWSSKGELAFSARRGTRWRIVRGTTELDGGEHVSEPVWSGDGERLAYVAIRGKETLAIVAGLEHRFDLAFDDSLMFSADGAHWAVIAGDIAQETLFISIDGVRRIDLPTHEVYSAATQGDPGRLRAWTAAELARSQGPARSVH